MSKGKKIRKQGHKAISKNESKKQKSPSVSKGLFDNNSQSNHWIYAIVVSILALIIYANTLGHGFTVDDPLLITDNEFVQKGISGIGEIWTSSYLEGYNGEVDAAYRPVSLTQFAIGQTFFDGKASIMHFFHILFYGFAILLTYLFCFQLFKGNKLLALGVSLLFLSHPIHTEVVNNLKSRDEIMMLIGTIGLGYFYLRHLLTRDKKPLVFALLFYALALFSKETSIAFFLLIPVLYYWNQQKWESKSWKDTGLFLGVSLFYFLIRTTIVGGYDIDLDYMNNALVNQGSFFGRFPDAIMLLGKYLVMLVWPYPLSVDYSYNSIPMEGWGSIKSILALVSLIGLTVAFVLGWKKKSFYLIPIAWFFVTIIVASNVFILIGSTFAERFLFIPSFAFCLALGYFLHSFIKNKTVYIAIIGGIAMLYSIWTFQRNTHWVDDVTLFSRDVVFQENNARVQTFYGKFLYDEGKTLPETEKTEAFKKAGIALEKATELAPDYFAANYFNGFLKKSQKDYPAAVKSFRKAIRIDSTFRKGRIQYATALSYNQEYNEAVKQFEILEKQGDKSSIVQVNKGHCLLQLKRYDEAEKALLKAHNMDPKNIGVLSNLIKLYRDGKNDTPSAIKYNDKLRALK